MNLTMSKCRYCPMPILWAKHPESDRAMPLDLEPSAKGTWRVEEREGELVAVYVKKADRGGELFGEEPLHESHWSTCAGAKQARIDADAKAARR